jgi:hypothetical protein
MYFLAWRTRAGRTAYIANLIIYVAYCLITTERDFIFVLFSLALHRQLFHTVRILRAAALGGGLLLFATLLFAIRSGGTVGTTEILNQGSLLFVDTFIMELAPLGVPFLYGASYLGALGGLVPGLGGMSQSLSGWLVDTYAPGSGSGYGFSLTGEAYLNFGMAGIPIMFALFTALHRLLVNRVDRSQLWGYMSILYTTAWMYAFRGESLAFLKTVVVGLILYLAVQTAWSKSSKKEGSSAPGRRLGTPIHTNTGRSSVDASSSP